MDKIKVARAKVTENGKILENVPSLRNWKWSKRNIYVDFSATFCLDEVEKVMSKISITNFPSDMTDEAFFIKICDKDAFLGCEMNIEAIFSVVKSWTSKEVYWNPNFQASTDKMLSAD